VADGYSRIGEGQDGTVNLVPLQLLQGDRKRVNQPNELTHLGVLEPRRIVKWTTTKALKELAKR
jgi:hypothetical protein